MLKPTQMTKITVIGTQSHLKKVIDELYALNVLHIDEHVKDDVLDIGTPLPDSTDLSELLIKLNAVLALLGIKPRHVPIDTDKKLELVLAEARARVDEVTQLENEQTEVETDLKQEEERSDRLRLLKKLGLEPDDLTSLQHAKVLLGMSKDKEIRKDLAAIPDVSYEIVLDKEGFLLGIVMPNEAEEKVTDVLTKYNVSMITFTGMDRHTSTDEALKLSHMHCKVSELRLGEIRKKLAAIRKANELSFLEARERVIVENEKAEAPLKFGVTAKTFLVTGYVPSENLLLVHRNLSKATDDTVIVYLNKIDGKESVPIKMDHPKLIKPFEFFVNLYSLPSYREIDPTFFTFLTFPFLFGFMLGDMGYGLVNLFLFLWLKKKFPAIKQLLNIMVWAAIFTILAGAAFGEFFGFEEFGHFEIPHLLSRTHAQMDLLVVAIVIGALHITFGLIIGFINEFRNHGIKHAVLGKLSWLILLVGAAMFIFQQQIAGYILVGLAIIMLLWGEGFMGLIELPGIFGNILSYARLMALGLASVSLAAVINKFAAEFVQTGGFMILAAVAIMVVGHAINMLLGIIGPFLHSLRLHYVEFFSKFYKGGGKLYRPFGHVNSQEQEST